MSSLFKTPKMPKTALPVPGGRAGTILTGALEPMDTGKRTLLG